MVATAALPPPPAAAYVIKPLPTLGFTAAESTHILLVRVEKVSREKGVIVYQKVRDLRGNYPTDTLTHAFRLKDAPAVAGQVFRPEADEWGFVLHGAEPGKEAVAFIRTENTGGDPSRTHVAQCRYAGSATAGDGVWFHTRHTSPDMLRTDFCGSPARLAVAGEAMLARAAGSITVQLAFQRQRPRPRNGAWSGRVGKQPPVTLRGCRRRSAPSARG